MNNLFDFMPYDEEGKKPPYEYVMEFMNYFSNNKQDEAFDLLKDWLEDYPKDKNVHAAMSIYFCMIIAFAGKKYYPLGLEIIDAQYQVYKDLQAYDFLFEDSLAVIIGNFQRQFKGEQ